MNDISITFTDIVGGIDDFPSQVLEDEIFHFLDSNEPDLALSNLIATIVARRLTIKPPIYSKICDLIEGLGFLNSQIVWDELETKEWVSNLLLCVKK